MKYKSAAVGFGYFGGLLLASCFGSLVDFVIGAVLFFLTVFMLVFKNKLPFVLLLTMSIAFIVYSLNGYFIYEPILALDGQRLEIEGRIYSKSVYGNDSALYIVETSVNKRKIKISFFEQDSAADINDYVSFSAVVNTFSDNAVFAERSYNHSKGIFLEANSIDGFYYEKSDSKSIIQSINNLNKYIKDKIIIKLPNDYGALLCAMFLGDKSYLSDELAANIRRSGVSHFTAVSGLHLTLLAGMFLPFLSFIRSRYKRHIKFFVLLIIIIFFILFFNMSPSVLRAGIMLIVFYGSELFLRRQSAFNSLGFALLLILAFQPLACRDVGLILSVCGCFGVGVAGPAINSKIKTQNFIILREGIITALSACFFTVPVAGIFFGGLSTVSLVTNIMLAPLVLVLLAMVLLFMITGGVLDVFLLLGGICSKLIVNIINILGELKYSYISLDYSFMLPWVIATFIFITIIHFGVKKLTFTINAGLFSLMLLISMITAFDLLVSDYTHVRTFSDGGSGAVIVRNKDACAVIATNDSNRVRKFILDYLRDSFLGEASVIVLLGSSNNALPLFMELPAQNVILPNDNVVFDINGVLGITKTDAEAKVCVSDTVICISSVARADNTADIQILYNKGTTDEIGNADKIVYISSSQTAERENETNAYHDKSLFYIKGGHK